MQQEKYASQEGKETVYSDNLQHVFLIGAKSLGAYGGYETFVNKLTEYHQNNAQIKYHVACKANGDGCMDPYKVEGAFVLDDKEFIYHNAHCFRISIPERFGAAQAIYYDCAALKESIRIIREQKLEHPVVYIMACRIGPFVKKYYRQIRALGGRVFLNPDGHEWLRAKWSMPVRKYWKLSEQLMVKWSDLVVCDSVNMEQYIHKSYDAKGQRGRNPKTTFIAYGAETARSRLADNDLKLLSWYREKGLSAKNYYLVVGRFVPENNYETMIREFMKSNTKRDLAIVTTANNIFLEELETKLGFKKDSRIKFVGTVYEQELLKKIRENAYGYLHGHEVGGTNPSLLEAMGSTELNLLLDVGFNREVAEYAAIYWTKDVGSLAGLIDKVDEMGTEKREEYGKKAKERIRTAYSWQSIGDAYLRVWNEGTIR